MEELGGRGSRQGEYKGREVVARGGAEGAEEYKEAKGKKQRAKGRAGFREEKE
jgi:hypothetical protein